jgi:hypothetical protein
MRSTVVRGCDRGQYHHYDAERVEEPTGSAMLSHLRLRPEVVAVKTPGRGPGVNTRLADGTIRQAEVHWYEASGFGRRETKIKRLLRDDP